MFGGGIKGKNLSTDVSKWNNGGWLQLHDNIIKSTIHISRMSLHGYRILQTQDILIPKTIHETPWTQCQSVLRRGGSQVTDSYLTDSHLTETDWLDRLSTGRLLRWLHLTRLFVASDRQSDQHQITSLIPRFGDGVAGLAGTVWSLWWLFLEPPAKPV